MRVGTMLSLSAAALLLLPRAEAADTYKIDPAHTSLTFSVRHMGLSKVKGHFDEFTGSIKLHNGVIKDASGTVQVKSVNTGIPKRDEHLRGADFFDVAKHPTITFKTKRVEQNGGQTVLVADFTLHGVTRELRLPATLEGPTKDPWGSVRIALEARTKLNRKDYGLNFHQVLDTGALLVGEEVEVEINAEAIKEAGNK